jgi:hypothetical protein
MANQLACIGQLLINYAPRPEKQSGLYRPDGTAHFYRVASRMSIRPYPGTRSVLLPSEPVPRRTWTESLALIDFDSASELLNGAVLNSTWCLSSRS